MQQIGVGKQTFGLFAVRQPAALEISQSLVNVRSTATHRNLGSQLVENQWKSEVRTADAEERFVAELIEANFGE